MFRFIVDTQLPPKLAKALKATGYDSVHTTYYPDGHLLSDEQIVALAIAEDRIVVTKDWDFLDRYIVKGIPPKVLLLRFGNISNDELLSLFELNLPHLHLIFTEGAGLVIFDRSSIAAF